MDAFRWAIYRATIIEWANRNGFEYVEVNEMGLRFIDLVKGDLKIWCSDTELSGLDPRWLVNQSFQETFPSPDFALTTWNERQNQKKIVLDT